MIWFSSDCHLAHARIIEHCNRPFSNVEEMNSTIIERYNQCIRSNDIFYFLGDFIFSRNGKLKDVYHFAEQLNCKKIHFILGNHDKVIRKNREQLLKDRVFLSIEDVIYLQDTTPRIFMSHYAHKVWPTSHYGTVHCYGHSHGTLKDDPNSLSMDIGVDTNDFWPYSLDDITDVMKGKVFVPLDHHDKNTE